MLGIVKELKKRCAGFARKFKYRFSLESSERRRFSFCERASLSPDFLFCKSARNGVFLNFFKLSFKNLSALLYFVFLIVVIFVYYLSLAPKNFPEGEFLFELRKGSTVNELSLKLKEAGMIKSPELFELWLVLRYGKVKAGDYLFKEKENMWSLARRFALGLHNLEPVKIRVKEGATREEIAEILSSKILRFDKEKFLQMSAEDEGFLFPDTYFFLPNAKEEEIIKTMKDNFSKKTQGLFDEMKNFDVKELVTLASLVEREAHKYEDRRKIAGVLFNRLKRNMPLQVDATWFYTHNKGSFGITLSELKDKSNPYNTYVHKGLPPTPIGSPSLSALKAVTNPAKHDYFFYLADKSGKTHFSKTYKEHLRKKRIYIDSQR